MMLFSYQALHSIVRGALTLTVGKKMLKILNLDLLTEQIAATT